MTGGPGTARDCGLQMNTFQDCEKPTKLTIQTGMETRKRPWYRNLSNAFNLTVSRLDCISDRVVFQTGCFLNLLIELGVKLNGHWANKTSHIYWVSSPPPH